MPYAARSPPLWQPAAVTQEPTAPPTAPPTDAPAEDFRATNRALWDERAPAHAASPGFLELTSLVEHDSVPWEALPGQMEPLGDTGEWRLADRPERLPHTYPLQAVRRRCATRGCPGRDSNPHVLADPRV